MRQRRDPEVFLAHRWALDDLLSAHGHPRSSPWWAETTERFERSGKRRRVIRKGRRVGASTIIAPRQAVCEMLWGEHEHTPGTPPLVYAFLSIKREEAANRLRGIKAILDILGERYHEAGDSIELESHPAIFKVVTASFRMAVGETVAWAWLDELARWLDDLNRPRAEDTVASIAPALATLPNSSLWLVSSPWSLDDYHARQFDRGETADQAVAFGETWVINPTLTEAETRELEPHGPTWEREYAARPGAVHSAAIPPEDIENCYDREPVGKPRTGFVAIDASSLRGDAFAFICGHVTDADELVVIEVDGWNGPALKTASMEVIVARIAARARAWNVDTVFGDQREEAALRALFAQHDVSLTSFAWSEQSKDDAVQFLRREMRSGRVIIQNGHPQLKRELIGTQAKLMPTGRLRYELNGKDFASCLVTLAHAAVAGHCAAADCELVFVPKAELDHYGEPAEPFGSRLQKLPGGKYRINPTYRAPGRNGPFGGQSV